MKRPASKSRQRHLTRREFVGGAVAAAGVFARSARVLRGQNLNNKLNIAFIACGGRGNASLSELTIVPGPPPNAGRAAATRRPRRRRIRTRTSRSSATSTRTRSTPRPQRFPKAKKFTRPPAVFDHPERLRRRRRLHRGAHARVRHLPRADARQARLLREAAHLQYLGNAPDSRDRREVPEAVHADGQPGACLAGAPHDQGNPRYRRRSARCAKSTSGPTARGGCRTPRRPRSSTSRTGSTTASRSSTASRKTMPVPSNDPLGSVARARAGAAVPRHVFPGTALVSLVGFRQRHDERPRQPRQRRAVHRARHPSSR